MAPVESGIPAEAYQIQ